MKQRARGVRRGTADSLCRIDGYCNIWCEWKQPGKKPDDDQIAFGERLALYGDIWFWSDSVVYFGERLERCGIKLRTGWREYALDHDLRAAAEIERAENRKPSRGASKPRQRLTARDRRAALNYARALP